MSRFLYSKVDPPHIKEAECFQIYCRIIYSMLHRDGKRLSLGPCKRLQAYLSQLNVKDIHKGTPEDYPAIGALGYALSALHQYEPWKMEIDPFDADGENFETMAAREQYATFRDFELSHRYADEEMDEYDDGTLIPTV